MRVNSAFHLVLFMISIIATCVQAENQAEKYPKNKITKRITKREASVLIDNYPSELINKPHVVVKRISKIKGYKNKSRHNRLAKRTRPGKSSKSGKNSDFPKVKRIPTAWSPYKKNKKTFYSYKQGSARRPVKSVKLRPASTYKSMHNSKPRNSHMYKPPRPAGFGEPPVQFGSYIRRPPEPGSPVNSYGAPLAALPPLPYEPYPLDGTPELDFDMPPEIDSGFAFSNTHAKVVVPDVNPFDNPVLMDINDNNIEGYQNIFHLHKKRQNTFIQQNKKTPKVDDFDIDVEDFKSERQSKDHELVGGLYAEPPARFLPKSHTEQSKDYEEWLFSAPDVFKSSKFASSANISPYVNYKNGNIAFSPQNLNDAFSIIDK